MACVMKYSPRAIDAVTPPMHEPTSCLVTMTAAFNTQSDLHFLANDARKSMVAVNQHHGEAGAVAKLDVM